MADKSPRQGMSQKSGNSLKEKRAIKKGKADAAPGETIFTGSKKH